MLVFLLNLFVGVGIVALDRIPTDQISISTNVFLWAQRETCLFRVQVAPLPKLMDDYDRFRQVVDHALRHPRRERLLQCPALRVHHSGDIRVPDEVFFFVNFRRP